VVGLGAAASNADTADQAVDESGMVLRQDQHAVIADVDEETYAPIDSRMNLSAESSIVVLRATSQTTKWKELDPYFVPYDYDPVVAADRV
jgi:hypothetical protein